MAVGWADWFVILPVYETTGTGGGKVEGCTEEIPVRCERVSSDEVSELGVDGRVEQ